MGGKDKLDQPGASLRCVSKYVEQHLHLYFDLDNAECPCSDKIAIQNVNNFKTSFLPWR